MPQNEKELLITVRADIRQSLSEMKRMRKEIAQTGKQSQKSAGQVSSLGRSTSLLAGAAGAYLALNLSSRLIKEADAYNTLQVRIRSATRETGDYAEVSERIFAISKQNGTVLAGTVDVFQRLQLSAAALGGTNEEVLTLTDTVQKLGVIGGSTSGQLRAGTLQFTQALASGVVRAEEINSVIENLPLLATRLEKTLGILPGLLKKSVNEGKVLSKDVFEALLRIAPEVAEEFKEIPISVERAGVSLDSSIGRLLGNLSESLGIAQALTGAMEAAANAADTYSKNLEISNSPIFKLGLELKKLQRQLESKNNQGLLHDWVFGTSDEIESRISDIQQELAELKGLYPDDLDGFQEFILPVDNLDEVIEQMERWETVVKNIAAVEVPAAEDKPEKISQSERLVRALELEAASYGRTSAELALYKLSLQEATNAQTDRAQAALSSIEIDAEFEAAVRASEEAVKAENLAYHEWLDTLSGEAQQVLNAAADAQENLSKKISRYTQLLNLGIFTQKEYDKAVAKAESDFEKIASSGTDAFDQLEGAVRGWGDEFTNTLTDMVVEGKANFKDLANSIIKDLVRIAIQKLITDKIVKAATGSLNKAGGGYIHGPGTATSDSIPANLSNGEYVVKAAAVDRYGIPFFEALNNMRQPRFANVAPIKVSTPQRNFATGGLAVAGRQAQAMGNIKIEIENKGSPSEVESADINFDFGESVIRVILNDQNTNGPATQGLVSRFNLRRTPR